MMVPLPWFPGVLLITLGLFMWFATRRRWRIVRMPALKWDEFRVSTNYLFGAGLILTGVIMLIRLVL